MMSSAKQKDNQKTILILGALRFVHTKPVFAYENKILQYMNFADPKWVETFYKMNWATKDELLMLGEEARRGRCNQQFDSLTMQPKAGQAIEMFWPYKDDDFMVDGVCLFSKEAEDLRMLRGPSWANNCCAFTVAFMCALWSNLGRKVCDQLPPPKLVEMDEPIRLLRMILSFDLSRYSVAHFDSFRDILIECLAHTDMTRWGALAEGEFSPCLTLIDYFYQGAPQMMFTYVSAYRCCDSVWDIGRGTKPTQQVGFHHTHEHLTLEVGVQSFFGGSRSKREDRCSMGEDCLRLRRKSPLVLDRLPPTMVIRTPGMHVHKAMTTAQAFKSFTVECNLLNGQEIVQYRPYLAVYRVNKNHFVARVRLGEQVWEHDGLRGGDAYKVKDWQDGLKGYTELILVQFEQYGKVVREVWEDLPEV